jgi:hypothetical protein
MQVKDKTYYFERESSVMKPCSGCAADDDPELCSDLTLRVNCAKDRIIWKEATEKTMKPMSKEIDDWVANNMPQTDDWVANNMPQTDVQIAGTKYDDGKVQYTLVPPYALQEVARNLTEGLKKYKERNNWQKVPNAEQRYMDALMRHFEAIRRGELYDVDSTDPTTSHMSAVAVNALFLLEFMYNPDLKSVHD